MQIFSAPVTKPRGAQAAPCSQFGRPSVSPQFSPSSNKSPDSCSMQTPLPVQTGKQIVEVEQLEASNTLQ